MEEINTQSISAKLDFINIEFPKLLEQLKSDTQPLWGQMNAQQMVEHLTDYVRVASGKTKVEVVTPEEQIPAFKRFLESEKQFRPETKNPLNGGAPVPERKKNLQEAVEEYQNEIKDFFRIFGEDKQKITPHPAFGYSNFDEWIKLHYKHLTHHARQFGLMQ